MQKKFPLLNNHDLEKVTKSLHYLRMPDLKNVCEMLHLPENGMKNDLINRVLSFIKTGTISQLQPVPPASRAKKGVNYPLAPNTLMLFGNYKNDHATRAFFKKLIGDYFHFTAFGIDWIKERWQKSKPPTYAEFAQFWVKENEARKKIPVKPKDEWAYINFVQRYIHQNPQAPKQQITQAWEHARDENIHIVQSMLKKIL